MKRIYFGVIAVTILISLAAVLNINRKFSQTDLISKNNNMKISSPVFLNSETIPAKYTCDGENVNPPLLIEGAPLEAKSLVLIVDDPDAPMGTWTHWTVWNINPDTREISENSVPPGAVQGKTSFGKPGYGGPCPPSGTHRYFFRVYALDKLLDLSSTATINDIKRAMQNHILDSGEFFGIYSRKK